MDKPVNDSLLTTLLYPNRCLVCGGSSVSEICEHCKFQLCMIKTPVCPICGYNLNSCCCKSNEIALPHFAAPFIYDGAVRNAIHLFKFDGEIRLADYFAEQMAQTAATEFPLTQIDFVCCVPMTKAERREKPFNHSKVLAKRVAALLSMRFIPDAIVKSHETERQHKLTSRDRLINPCGAYQVNQKRASKISNSTILLCDDIKTTGATLNECCKALFEYGATDVWCLCASLSVSMVAL